MKTEGKITLRFRLRDGRKVDLYHKSKIEADLSDLSKFEVDGTPKKRVNYNRKLYSDIKKRISLMQSIYENAVKEGKTLTTDRFEELIDRELHPEKYKTAEEIEENKSFLESFREFVDRNSYSSVRRREYWIVVKNLTRYLNIKGQLELGIKDFSATHITDFHNYLLNEYKYAAMKKYSYLFTGRKGSVPTEPPRQNTLQSKVKMLKCFCGYLEESDLISISPFRKLSKNKRGSMMREAYNTPISLTKEEMRLLIETEVPHHLEQTRDAFILQCALGARISDFSQMDMSYLHVSHLGIPYVLYRSKKTGLKTETPIIGTAFRIIRKYDFNIPILKNISGKDGYNKALKELARYLNFGRQVEVGSDNGKIIFAPLHEVFSSKLARKTNVTLCADIQVDTAIMGLHERGSSAIRNYDAEGLMRKFKIVSLAFGEPLYKVDEDLNIIEWDE